MRASFELRALWAGRTQELVTGVSYLFSNGVKRKLY